MGPGAAHLVDKLHDALAVAELHHSRGRRVQAARVGHQRWLGHAHQHHPLRRPLHHSPPSSSWWCSAELYNSSGCRGLCSSDSHETRRHPLCNEPCRLNTGVQRVVRPLLCQCMRTAWSLDTYAPACAGRSRIRFCPRVTLPFARHLPERAEPKCEVRRPARLAPSRHLLLPWRTRAHRTMPPRFPSRWRSSLADAPARRSTWLCTRSTRCAQECRCCHMSRVCTRTCTLSNSNLQ